MIERIKDKFLINTQGLKKLKDIDGFLIDDPNIGFFYTDFFMKIPYIHTEFPSVITKYPAVIFPVDKYNESLGKNQLEYLASKYIAVHIPVIAYEVIV